MTVYVRTFQNQEAELLQAIQKAGSAPAQLVQRAHIITWASEEMKPAEVARAVGLSVGRVREWIERFNEYGLLGLFDQPRSGRPREYTAQQALQVVEVATTAPTELGAPLNTWSLSHLQRYLEAHTPVGWLCRGTIRAILHEHGISYQEAQRWQESNDPEFESKKEAIVSCYLGPPPNSLILCFDQKGPVQFKQRGGHQYRPRNEPAHVPDEYTRHGTGYLLAALNPHSGQIWGRCFLKYNSGTVIWFLGWLLRQLPDDVHIIIIWDNASPHSKTVKRWLHKRFGDRVQWLHIPTKAAWLNLIEAWMSMFERDVIRNSNFQSLADFSLAAKRYLVYYNAQRHPFRWGHKRKRRVFLVGPLRRTVLWGRASRASLPDRLARRLAKMIITS
jgi:transposase